ncbi:hypothetical protein GH714_033368 [Hevea brasiliensis]|uniref:G-patch domain-containing protein n=1 Tax=Hevea brasiliensis TaxID=3981 RepID=A0A6A6NKK6_HEVBR|nr:hypothetical protein GH714_033368 [Hevea brasiliensis]
MDTFRDREIDSYQELDKFRDGYRNTENYYDHGFDRGARFGGRDRDDYAYDDYDYRPHVSSKNREDSHDRDYEYGRHSYDSDYEGSSKREGNWRKHESRDRERNKRGLSWERDKSPHKRHERSRSRGRDDRLRSRSPRGRSHGRSQRENNYNESQHERTERWRDHEEKRQRGNYTVAPSATVVVKGLSQKTTEEDLYQMLAEWGPLRHVRVIKERNSGISRGFAFIDFPSVNAACAMMDRIGDDGLVVDGRKLFFEYRKYVGTHIRVKPCISTSAATFLASVENIPLQFLRDYNIVMNKRCRCNEPRTEDAPPADVALSNPTSLGRKGFEAGPTHVLVVRGLDENADEEMLRYEFSKHAPIKDLRLVRDKFTHVSRGFAFVHFHSVEDATKALEATNGTALEKNGQILRVAYAKSIIGAGSGASGHSQSSSLAAAAIEAAAFAQQEYNPDDKSTSGQEQDGGEAAVQKDGSTTQSGFVWDEASGYYYDAASGFYYDGNTGFGDVVLERFWNVKVDSYMWPYYDGNSGIWYSFDHQTQQYIPCTDQNDNQTSDKLSEHSKPSDTSNNRKVIISAPAATITSAEKVASLPDAVQAAATAALAAEKKEKEKSKEIKLASKSSILASKKKMNNVLTMWKQRSYEGQATRVTVDDNQPSGLADDRSFSVGQATKSKFKSDAMTTKESAVSPSGIIISTTVAQAGLDSPVKPRPVSNSSGGTLMGVIRGSGRGVVKSDASYSGSSSGVSTFTATAGSSTNADTSAIMTPFRTDASALGSYATPASTGSGKRRFSEMPLSSASAHKENSQSTYRDRAAERRSLYGSSSSTGDDRPDIGFGDSGKVLQIQCLSHLVGGGLGTGDVNVNAQSYEVITADRAIDESNVGNRMLRRMGWHEGLGLGKDGSGMIEPVQAKAMENRAGLGSRQKKLDPSLEVQAGDSYKTLIHKKALARFREMSDT